MEELVKWLNRQKISFRQVDAEVVEIEDFGSVFVADLSEVSSIFRKKGERLEFNLPENPAVLLAEGIKTVAFPFGENWYYWNLEEEFALNILKYVGRRQRNEHDYSFVNLGIHSPFELLNGSFPLQDWVKKAQHLGHTCIGICDKNTMAGSLALQKACDAAHLGFVMGYTLDFRLADEKHSGKIYCQSQKGLQNLLRIQKEVAVDSDEQSVDFYRLLEYAEGNVFVFGKLSSYWMAAHPDAVGKACAVFDRVYYQFDLSEYKANRFDTEVLEATRFYMRNLYGKEVAPVLICDTYYLDPEDARNKIVLNKIDTGAAHLQSSDQYFKDADEHYVRIAPVVSSPWEASILMKEMCDNTLCIADGAKARYETGQMFMPSYEMKPEEVERYGDRHRMFLELIEEGLQRLIAPEKQEAYRKRLAEEVYVIESTNNIDYFLVQWDLVSEARRRGIAVGIGRGSAGGCLILYLLGITALDPLKYDLLFSRFLVPERCGLEWDQVSITGQDVVLEAGEAYAEIGMAGRKYLLHRDAELLVKRSGQEMVVFADELEKGDEVIWDNRDLLWTLNEL